MAGLVPAGASTLLQACVPKPATKFMAWVTVGRQCPRGFLGTPSVCRYRTATDIRAPYSGLALPCTLAEKIPVLQPIKQASWPHPLLPDGGCGYIDTATKTPQHSSSVNFDQLCIRSAIQQVCNV